jgi:hypothetical protein
MLYVKNLFYTSNTSTTFGLVKINGIALHYNQIKILPTTEKVSVFDSVFQEPFGVSIVSTPITELCKATN